MEGERLQDHKTAQTQKEDLPFLSRKKKTQHFKSGTFCHSLHRGEGRKPWPAVLSEDVLLWAGSCCSGCWSPCYSTSLWIWMGFSSDSRLIFLVGSRLVQRNHPRTLERIELEHVPRFISKDANFKGDRYTTVTIGEAGNKYPEELCQFGILLGRVELLLHPKVSFSGRHPKMNQPCFKVISGSWNWMKYHKFTDTMMD